MTTLWPRDVAPAWRLGRGRLWAARFKKPAFTGTLLLLTALWLATRRYNGIFHDARLYAVQALNEMLPGRYSNDLFFKYGSQDSFTLFSYIYRPFIGLMGLPAAHLAGVIVGEAFWLSGLAAFLSSIFKKARYRTLSAVGVIAMTALYGGASVFKYGEPFLTPRLFAEAFALYGFAFALHNRPIFAVVAVLLAAAFHPLMAIVSAGCLVTYYALSSRRNFLVALAITVACSSVGLALAYGSVEPFVRFLKTYDPTWFSVVWQRCPFAFLTEWDWDDLATVVAQISVLATSALYFPKRSTTFIWAVVAASGASLLLSFVGSDVARNILLTNLQVWRVLWVTTLLANACLPVLIAKVRNASVAREVLIIAFVASVARTMFWVPAYVPPFLEILGCLTLAVERKFGDLLLLARTCVRFIALGLVGWTALVVAQQRSADQAVSFILTAAVVCLILLAIVFARRLSARVSFASAAIVLLAICAIRFDARPPWAKFLETDQSLPAFNALLAGDRNIFFAGGADLPWLKLRRPDYFSCTQGTGSMFYRATALEYERRRIGVSAMQPGLCLHSVGKEEVMLHTREGLTLTCARLADLDAVVDVHPIPGIKGRSISLPVAFGVHIVGSAPGHSEFTRQLYAYACRDVVKR